MNALKLFKEYKASTKAHAAEIASLTDEHFFARVEALDTIFCPECKSKIIDEPYLVTRCNICSWSENGIAKPCSTLDCEGEAEQITSGMAFCFDCNTPTYDAEETEAEK